MLGADRYGLSVCVVCSVSHSPSTVDTSLNLSVCAGASAGVRKKERET